MFKGFCRDKELLFVYLRPQQGKVSFLPTHMTDIKPDDFTITDLQDEIRVDELCQKLLKTFHRHLLDTAEVTRLEAGSLAGGADYFLRDFVIDSLRGNMFAVTAVQVRGFAGNWYIHRTLEPNMKELESILRGVASLYQFYAANGWIRTSVSDEIRSVCADLDYFRRRIESFHNLAGDDYPDWCEECPLE